MTSYRSRAVRALCVGALICAMPLAWAANPASLLVKDLSTGSTLVSDLPDETRYPASLTKLMTLYILFEKLDSGELRLDQKFTVSENAAHQPPSKVGFRVGATLTIEECIGAVIVKSANDAAVVVAEGIAGDEQTFAAMMTRKAKVLGMDSTLFRNASGLPDAEQVTTARDLSTLATALVEKFPRYYHYFAVRECKVGRKTIETHNNFLVEYPGAEGMKTGYTRDAGYNLVATAQRGGHRLVGVILGAAGPARRDGAMIKTMDAAFGSLGISPPGPEPPAKPAGAKGAAASRPSAQPPARSGG